MSKPKLSCPHCGREDLSPQGHPTHVLWCAQNPDRSQEKPQDTPAPAATDTPAEPVPTPAKRGWTFPGGSRLRRRRETRGAHAS